ncbi:rnhA, partial [Mucuna pruriens]
MLVTPPILTRSTPAPIDECSSNVEEWFLFVDRASNQRGSRVGVILEGPNRVLIKQSLCFEFRASTNQAEYKALLARMKLAGELGVHILMAKSDSKLITSQVNGDYREKDRQLVKYWDKATKLAVAFEKFILLHVPPEQNERVDLLSKLASTQRSDYNHMDESTPQVLLKGRRPRRPLGGQEIETGNI